MSFQIYDFINLNSLTFSFESTLFIEAFGLVQRTHYFIANEKKLIKKNVKKNRIEKKIVLNKSWINHVGIDISDNFDHNVRY